MKLRHVARRLRGSADYLADYRRYARMMGTQAGPFPPLSWDERHAVVGENTDTTEFDRHYVYHTAWAARVLSRTGSAVHHDFGSLLYFATMVSAFRPVRFYDYRPAALELTGLESGHADLTALPFPAGSLASVSCMHVVEHIGLGRYGDPLDPHGDSRACSELQRVLAPGGDLLFVVPVGRPRVCFNAHRVYSYAMVLDMFPECDLVQFNLAPDPGYGADWIEVASPDTVAEQEYGCGCFWLRKRQGDDQQRGEIREAAL